LRVPAPVPITKINISYKKREKVTPGFILREMPDNRDSNHENEESGKKKVASQEATTTDEDTHNTDNRNPESQEIADNNPPVSNEKDLENTTRNHLKDLQEQEDNIVDTRPIEKSKYVHEIELD